MAAGDEMYNGNGVAAWRAIMAKINGVIIMARGRNNNNNGRRHENGGGNG